jgi:hypothetical protein
MGLPPWFGGAVLGSCRGFGGGTFCWSTQIGDDHPSSIYHRDAYIIYPYKPYICHIPEYPSISGIHRNPMVKIPVKMFSEVLLPTHPE